MSNHRQASFLLWDGASCGGRSATFFYGKTTEQDVGGEAISYVSSLYDSREKLSTEVLDPGVVLTSRRPQKMD